LPPKKRSSAFDNSPIDLTPKDGEVVTNATKLKKSGQNLYQGNVEAVARGKETNRELCRSCRMPDGSRDMGPTLIEDYRVHNEIKTDANFLLDRLRGRLWCYAAIKVRLSQDDVLKVSRPTCGP
jgi:hypothetical protein